MSIFSKIRQLFNKKDDFTPKHLIYGDLLDKIFWDQFTFENDRWYHRYDLNDNEHLIYLVNHENQFKKQFVFYLVKEYERMTRILGHGIHWTGKEPNVERTFTYLQILEFLIKTNLGFSSAEYIRLFRMFRISDIKGTGFFMNYPVTILIRQIEKKATKEGIDIELSNFIWNMLSWSPIKGKEGYTLNDKDKLRNRIKKIREVNGDTKVQKKKFFSLNDNFGKEFKGDLKNTKGEIEEVFLLCWNEPHRSEPTKKWTKDALRIIEHLKNRQCQVDLFLMYFEHLEKSAIEYTRSLNAQKVGIGEVLHAGINMFKDFRSLTAKYYLGKENEIGMCYLIWYAGLMNDSKINDQLRRVALSSFRKIQSHGPLSPKIGNACLYAFNVMPDDVGIIQLINIRNKSVNKNILNLVNKYINLKAEELKISEDRLLELSAIDYGLINGQLKIDFDEYEAIIGIDNIKKLNLVWKNNKTLKVQKSIPKCIKELKKDELKDLRVKIKDITLSFNVHKSRLEQSYTNNTSWQINVWIKFYVKQPLLSRFGSLLIWYFDDKTTAILVGKKWIDENENEVELSKFSHVKLWHPIFSKADVVLSWRKLIINKELLQPFKQAFREIYVITEAELNTNSYSNRFAAHYLYQHQFSALAKIRNWNYQIQGHTYTNRIASKQFPLLNIYTEFWLDPVEGSQNDAYTYTYVATDQVKFYTMRQQVELKHVPAIAFTEIMRDLDMFISVCSIGNNEEWEDVGERFRDVRNYHQNFDSAELNEMAKTRKEVLSMIVPKLNISSQCEVKDKYLEVRGKLRIYKIHFGSSNILMLPNDQYLCIVKSQSLKTKKIFLPFDEDHTLSMIISKAFLLANDDKIKNASIISQIRG